MRRNHAPGPLHHKLHQERAERQQTQRVGANAHSGTSKHAPSTADPIMARRRPKRSETDIPPRLPPAIAPIMEITLDDRRSPCIQVVLFLQEASDRDPACRAT